ncbi:MAG TPA: FtsW/RodA/SpoVE family cell cycle protein, partial [Gaiellaceae bacterium]|nr:FtsW/RodA/SpoVE family cell cycle protein [Gaiellaceae bacterium]
MVDYAGPALGARARARAGALDVGAALRRLDWLLLLAVGGLVAYGLWAVAGITRFDVPGDPNHEVVRQAIAAGAGAVAFAVAVLVPPSLLQRHWRLLYVGTIGLMVFVFAVAEAIRGSKRWLVIGPFQFQPSEFGKTLFVLALAGFLVERSRRIASLRTVLAAIGLGAVPMVLVFLQPDFGTAMVYAAALAAVLFVAGTRWSHLGVLVVLVALLAVCVLWLLPAGGVHVLKEYQRQRITGFLNPSSDPSGATYNIT